MHAYQVFFSLLLLLVSESPVLVVVPEGVPQPEGDVDTVDDGPGVLQNLFVDAVLVDARSGH